MSMIGVKIHDGLFLGDHSSATDHASAMACKVTRVVNCCSGEISNQWESMGIAYLNFSWEDASGQIILDSADVTINKVFEFVEAGLAREEGVLIHSYNGQSRSVCLLAAYLMKKYRWGMRKTTEFLKTRSYGSDMKFGFLHQLQSYERRLASDIKGAPLAQDWNDSSSVVEPDELLIRNTYVNVRDLSEAGDVLAAGPKSATLARQISSSRRPSWSCTCGTDKQGVAQCTCGTSLQDKAECDFYLEDPLSPLSAMMGGGKNAPKLKSFVPYKGPLRSALKGAAKAPAPAQGCVRLHSKGLDKKAIVARDTGKACDATSVTIQKGSDQVEFSLTEIVPKRFGLKHRCSSIILEYEVPSLELRAHHVIKVSLSNACDKAIAANLLQQHPHWLNGVMTGQLAELVGRLRKGQYAVGGS